MHQMGSIHNFLPLFTNHQSKTQAVSVPPNPLLKDNTRAKEPISILQRNKKTNLKIKAT
jgi:hypothetical protein